MFKIALITLSCLLFLTSISQEKKSFTEAKEFVVNLTERYKEPFSIPFKQVIVKDFRFDTTKLGYINNNGLSRIVTKEKASISISNAINEYFGNNLDKNSDKSLLIVVKSFWFQQKAFDLIADDKLINKKAGYTDRTGVNFTDFEIFAFTNDGYQALLKFKCDFFDYKYNTSSIRNFFYVPFDSLIQKIHSLNIEQILFSKRKLSRSIIDSNYQSRYSLPVLKDDISEKGVFLTFNDFKYKKTSYPDFRVKKSDITDELHIKNNDKEEVLTDFWGYSDGKNYFMRVGYNFFKLTRQNNTFDLYGSKYISSVTRSIPVPIPGGPAYGELEFTKNKTDLRPLQLNMESGLTY